MNCELIRRMALVRMSILPDREGGYHVEEACFAHAGFAEDDDGLLLDLGLCGHAN